MRLLPLLFLLALMVQLLPSCGADAPPQSAAIRQRDSLPVMQVEGVTKLISDSGIARYRIIAEEWRLFDKTTPERQEFRKGLFLQRFDDHRRVNLYLTADTAYCYDQKLWKLRGRVVVCNEQEGITYRSEELYWDMRRHEFYANAPMHLRTPDRELRGNRFRSNEQLTAYEVINSRGHLPLPKSNAPTSAPLPMESDSSHSEASSAPPA